MAGRPPKVDHVRNGLCSEANSARNLVARVLALPRGVREGELHPKHARQIVELAFMGVVSAWDEFLERTLVRYVAGAVTDSGYAPTPKYGFANDLKHAYELLSGNTDYDRQKNHLRVQETKWVLQMVTSCQVV